MKVMSSTDGLSLIPPTLPKGGGSLSGMPITPGAIGSDGQASLTIALPITAGRGYAPALNLQYQSGTGNGFWGSGWLCNLPTVRRRTDHGVPTYTDRDIFLAPDGEILIPECNADGQIITVSTSTFGTQILDNTYQITRYFPCIENSFARFERWQAKDSADFWLIHSPSGEVVCLGKTPQARIADPGDPHTRIVSWLAEESVSPTGEHIYYQYVSAAEVGVDDPAGRDIQSQRVLSTVSYGNVNAQSALWLWSGDTVPAIQEWLFTLVFDYGALGTDSAVPPAFPSKDTIASWPVRQDVFSTFDAGFEIRTHFVCRQVLMFHHFREELGENSTLVHRLLITYDESPVLTRLAMAQSMAYEPDTPHTLQSLPPLELEYNTFSPPTQANAWHSLFLPDELGLNPYRLVDLYGEGIPGLLYQDNTGWYYRSPMRENTSQASPDAVKFGEIKRLPLVPILQTSQSINVLDIDGDGRLEWLVIQSDGLVGYYKLQADSTWSDFILLTSFPMEYLHPGATLADLHGAGFPDLSVIGPRSVRLYINERNGYEPGRNIAYNEEASLPVDGYDRQELVAFSDMLGSGKSHLVSVRHDRVLCWPNLGDGRFSKPLTLSTNLPFEASCFNPRQVYLVDVDGSGATDLIYVDTQGIHLFINQSGNTLAEPITFPYPAGVIFDELSQLHFADLAGLGTVSIILTQLNQGPYQRPRHWRYDLSACKPYLLNTINNNRGASTILTYRSSAQEWLDEKQNIQAAAPGIPFPVLVLSRTEQRDELTGHSLIHTWKYRRGYWDGKEREFRGFGYVESMNYDNVIGESGAVPLLTRTWYHTGRAEDVDNLYGTPYNDPAAFPVKHSRLTQWQGNADDGQDVEFAPDATAAWWMYRAMKGSLLRQESYGLDRTAAAAIPYTVSQSRLQVRQVQSGDIPVVQPLSAGSTTWNYERTSVDPHISQSVPLYFNGYGLPTWTVNLAYPRRLTDKSENPYATTALPADAWAATFDAQQNLLRITENRLQVRNQSDPQAWVLGIPIANRQNTLTYPPSECPATGFTLEMLLDPAGLLGSSRPRELSSQQQYCYLNNSDVPKSLVLLDHTETALLTVDDLLVYQNIMSDEECQQLLKEGGYHSMPALLRPSGAPDEPDVWAGYTEYKTYLGAKQFWLLKSQTAAQLPDKEGLLPVLTMVWDNYFCCMTSSSDVYNNTVSASIDYRFLIPWQTTDINGNNQEVQIDALGRMVASSQYGTELGPDGKTAVNVGFHALHTTPAPVNETVADAIAYALSVNQGANRQFQSTRVVYDMFSMMGQISLMQLKSVVSDAESLHKLLQSMRFITPQGHLLARFWRWAESGNEVTGIPSALRSVLQAAPREPVHYATLVAETWPDKNQQVGLQISHSDGFDRLIQTASLQPDGPAWQRKDNGELIIQGNHPEEAPSHPRWSISGRVEYNPRGTANKIYQPYFINSWQPVNDLALHASGYADTHYYDATGRETHTITAQGWMRRKVYTPWFTVSEDENDTLGETLPTADYPLLPENPHA